jgi:hypothetical protein
MTELLLLLLRLLQATDLQLGLSLVKEVDEVGGDWEEVGLGWNLVVVLPVPLVHQPYVVAHADQGIAQQLQLGRVDLGWDGAVTIPTSLC